MPDPTLARLDAVRANLAGVGRVFLSGGEPLLRRELPEIVDGRRKLKGEIRVQPGALHADGWSPSTGAVERVRRVARGWEA